MNEAVVLLNILGSAALLLWGMRMVSTGVGRGLLKSAMAQSVMLGANVGTSLVTKLLTYDTGPLSAAMVLGGVALFRSFLSTSMSLRKADCGGSHDDVLASEKTDAEETSQARCCFND